MKTVVSVLALFVFIVGRNDACADRYRARFLPTPSGLQSPVARAINNRGQIAVEAQEWAYRGHGLVWNTDGTIVDIGWVRGMNDTRVHDINDVGQVAGEARSWDTRLLLHGFVWSPTDGMSDRWAISEFRWSLVAALNSQGFAVGTGTNPQTGQVVPVRWDSDGGWQWLPTLRGVYGAASDINEVGQTVGYTDTPGWGEHACIWEPDCRIRDLGVLPGYSYSRGERINASGQVLGHCYNAWPYMPTLWNPDGSAVTIWHDGARDMWPMGMNDLGQIVGFWIDSSNHAYPFLYSVTVGFQEPGAPGTKGFLPQAINNKGIMVGSAVDLARNQRGACALAPIKLIPIDVRPDVLPNPRNLESKGTILVVVYGSPDVDASSILPSTLDLAGAKPLRWNLRHEKEGGDTVLLVHFLVSDLVFAPTSTTITLTGWTTDGLAIEGVDTIIIQPEAHS